MAYYVLLVLVRALSLIAESILQSCITLDFQDAKYIYKFLD